MESDTVTAYDDEAAERMADDLERGAGGQRRGGKGGRGRRGGRSGDQNREYVLSKALSTLLRHQAATAGIKLDAEGFAPLDKVLQWPRIRGLNPSVAEIKEAVADSPKQRFALKPRSGGAGVPAAVSAAELAAASASLSPAEDTDPASWLIRANQGHSITLASEALHTPLTLEAGNVPKVVVHGTYFAFWDAIVAAGGLKRMGRTHVHFGTGVPALGKGKGNGKGEEKDGEDGPAVVSGMRSDAELLIFVDVERCLHDGVPLQWWISANGVVLTEGDDRGIVPLECFSEVRGRAQGVGVLWRDGRKVADLPEDIVKTVPFGKAGSAGGDGGRSRGGGGRGRGRGRGGGKGGGGGR